MENTGKFIVFEGLDGSGKSTQIRLLEKHLTDRGRKVFLTAEPTNSTTGGILRDALSGLTRRTPAELAAAFLLDRIFHNTNPVSGIKKLLAEGYNVICDRYYYSSLAYQGAETDMDWVTRMNLECPDIRRPDLCIFIDLDPGKCMERISAGRASRDIFEEKEKLTRIRDAYFRVFEKLENGYGEHVVTIDGSGSIDETAKKIAQAADCVCA